MATLYYNGTFHTMNPDQPTADAVLCEQGVFSFVGHYADLDPETIAQADPQDLNEAHVFPGFILTHGAPAIQAFDQEAKNQQLTMDDGFYWVKEAMDMLNDHGISVLCLHESNGGLFRQIVGMDDTSIIYDMKYETEFEKSLDGSPEDLYDEYYYNILENPKTNSLLFQPLLDDCDSTEEAIDLLTKKAADGIEREDMGSIEVGKRANLSVFEENPLEKELSYFGHMHAQCIVCDGEIVYDVFAQAMDELYDLLSQQTF